MPRASFDFKYINLKVEASYNTHQYRFSFSIWQILNNWKHKKKLIILQQNIWNKSSTKMFNYVIKSDSLAIMLNFLQDKIKYLISCWLGFIHLSISFTFLLLLKVCSKFHNFYFNYCLNLMLMSNLIFFYL